jgi:hypothetical protein
MIPEKFRTIQERPEHLAQRRLLVFGRTAFLDVAATFFQLVRPRLARERGQVQRFDAAVRVQERTEGRGARKKCCLHSPLAPRHSFGQFWRRAHPRPRVGQSPPRPAPPVQGPPAPRSRSERGSCRLPPRGKYKSVTPLCSVLSLPVRYFFSLSFGSGLTTVYSQVEGATCPSFQASKENVTLALPSVASAGTRTGP